MIGPLLRLFAPVQRDVFSRLHFAEVFRRVIIARAIYVVNVLASFHGIFRVSIVPNEMRAPDPPIISRGVVSGSRVFQCFLRRYPAIHVTSFVTPLTTLPIWSFSSALAFNVRARVVAVSKPRWPQIPIECGNHRTAGAGAGNLRHLFDLSIPTFQVSSLTFRRHFSSYSIPSEVLTP